MENLDKKLLIVKRPGAVGNDGETIALLVSIGVNVMLFGFTGRKKLVT